MLAAVAAAAVKAAAGTAAAKKLQASGQQSKFSRTTPKMSSSLARTMATSATVGGTAVVKRTPVPKSVPTGFRHAAKPKVKPVSLPQSSRKAAASEAAADAAFLDAALFGGAESVPSNVSAKPSRRSKSASTLVPHETDADSDVSPNNKLANESVAAASFSTPEMKINTEKMQPVAPAHANKRPASAPAESTEHASARPRLVRAARSQPTTAQLAHAAEEAAVAKEDAKREAKEDAKAAALRDGVNLKRKVAVPEVAAVATGRPSYKRNRSTDQAARAAAAARALGVGQTEIPGGHIANAFTTGAKTLQAQVNSEVTRVLADFKILLERTVQIENNAYVAPQYGPFCVRDKLTAAVDDAILHMRRDLGLGETPEASVLLSIGAGKVVVPMYGKGGKQIDLHAACSAGSLARVTGSIAQKEAVGQAGDINGRNAQEQTALFLATRGGHYEVVTKLLEHKANPNLRCGPMLLSPLHLATKAAKIPLMKLLLEYGADRYQQSHAGKTSFDYPINLEAWTVLENTQYIHGTGTAKAAPVKSEPATDSTRSHDASAAEVKRIVAAASSPEAIKALSASAQKALAFNVKTHFLLAKTANAALQLPVGESVYAKHPHLFTHASGVGAQLVVMLAASEFRHLVKSTSSYKKVKRIKKAMAVLHTFSLNYDTIDAIHSRAKLVLSLIDAKSAA
jgi:ankyrin repeat protein